MSESAYPGHVRRLVLVVVVALMALVVYRQRKLDRWEHELEFARRQRSPQ
jgi:hypothetical protein